MRSSHASVGRLRALLLALALLLAPLLGQAPAASAQGPTPGTVMGWGEDFFGQVSNHPTDANYIAIAGGVAHSLALRSDGTVVAWGGDNYRQVADRPTDANYTAIAAGDFYNLALRRDGTIVGWGDDEYGQVSQRPTDANYIAIAAGRDHSLAIRRDGTVVAWGRDQEGQVSGRPTDAGYIAIEAGIAHSLALKSDGTVVVWGRDKEGQVSNRPTEASYIAIAAGRDTSLALRRDGTVVAWGRDDDGEVSGRPTDAGYIAIAAGYADNLALKSDGTVVTWGRNSDGSQTVPPGLKNVFAIARGNDHSLVLLSPDSTPPVITPDVTGTLNNGWYSSDVQLSWNVSDDESAITSTSGCDPQSVTTDTSGTTITCTATSAGGSASQNITIQRDATAPAVSVTGVANGASYPLGSVPAAGCSTTDAPSGVATQATLSITGGNADGSGSFTATCSGASDNAGNLGSASASYTVAYRWGGFLQPVDNLPTVNSVKAGSAVPVTFSLGGNYGLSIFASGYPKVQVVACSGGAPTDEVEQTVTAGASSLSYDTASGQYKYTWKTDKKWAGSCRQLVLKLIDGTEHIAGFKFK